MGLGSCSKVSPAFPPLSHHQARLSLGASKGPRKKRLGSLSPSVLGKVEGKRKRGKERGKEERGQRAAEREQAKPQWL